MVLVPVDPFDACLLVMMRREFLLLDDMLDLPISERPGIVATRPLVGTAPESAARGAAEGIHEGEAAPVEPKA